MHKIIVSMPVAKMSKLSSGKAINVSPADLDGDTEGSGMVRIHFKEKRHANKLLSNHQKRKGTRITPSQIEDIEVHEVSGGRNIFKSIGSTLKSVGKAVLPTVKRVVNSKEAKSVVKELKPVIKDVVKEGVSAAVGSQSNPLAGKVAGNMASNMVDKGSR